MSCPLPGGLVILNRSLIEDHEDPAVAAGPFPGDPAAAAAGPAVRPGVAGEPEPPSPEPPTATPPPAAARAAVPEPPVASGPGSPGYRPVRAAAAAPVQACCQAALIEGLGSPGGAAGSASGALRPRHVAHLA